nr:transposase [Thermostichus vulcanus]
MLDGKARAVPVRVSVEGVGQYDLSKLCAVLAKEFEWAGKLNSMARQASAERAWSAIKRFYDNCKAKKPGKKGFPRFKKNCRSVEYKTSGWKLSADRKHLTFTDGFKAGTFLLVGARDLHFYPISQIKRVRVVRKADGYYAQFCIAVDRQETIPPTGKAVGIDLGLKYFYKATDGTEVENPRFLRKSERKLKRLQRRVSKKQKGSQNRKKATNRLRRQHLKVSRQRKDWAVKQARLEKGLRLAGLSTVGHTGINASGQNDHYPSQAIVLRTTRRVIDLDKSAG